MNLISSIWKEITISAILFTIVSMFFGFYYELYEHFFNFIIQESNIYNTLFTPATNNDFGLFQLIMLLQNLMPDIEVYALNRLFFLFISITMIIHYIFQTIDVNKIKYLVLILFVIIIIDNIVFINSTRSAILLGFSSILSLILYYNKNSLHYLLMFFFLGFACIINRIEIGVIVFSIGVIIFFFYYIKYILLLNILMLFFAISAFAAFNYINFKNHYYAHNFLTNERKFTYQDAFIVSQNEVAELFFKEKSVDKDKAIAIGNVLYILDKPILNIYDVPSLLKYEHFIDNILNNPNYFKIYQDSFIDFLITLSKYKYHGVILLIFFFNQYFIYKNTNKRLDYNILIIFIPLIVLIPISVMLIGQNVHDRFLSPYFSIIILSFLFYNYTKVSNFKYKLLILLTLLFASLQFYNYTFPNYKLEKLKEHRQELLYNSFIEDNKIGNQPFVLSIISWEVIPRKLFSKKNINQTGLSFLIKGPYDNAPLFKEKKKLIYGDNYASLKERIMYVVQNSSEIYATQLEIVFLKNYLKSVHDVNIKFDIIEAFEDISFEDDVFNISKYNVSMY